MAKRGIDNESPDAWYDAPPIAQKHDSGSRGLPSAGAGVFACAERATAAAGECGFARFSAPGRAGFESEPSGGRAFSQACGAVAGTVADGESPRRRALGVRIGDRARAHSRRRRGRGPRGRSAALLFGRAPGRERALFRGDTGSPRSLGRGRRGCAAAVCGFPVSLRWHERGHARGHRRFAKYRDGCRRRERASVARRDLSRRAGFGPGGPERPEVPAAMASGAHRLPRGGGSLKAIPRSWWP